MQTVPGLNTLRSLQDSPHCDLWSAERSDVLRVRTFWSPENSVCFLFLFNHLLCVVYLLYVVRARSMLSAQRSPTLLFERPNLVFSLWFVHNYRTGSSIFQAVAILNIATILTLHSQSEAECTVVHTMRILTIEHVGYTSGT